MGRPPGDVNAFSVVVAGVSCAAGSDGDAKQMTMMDETPPYATLKPGVVRHSDVKIDGEAVYMYRHAPS